MFNRKRFEKQKPPPYGLSTLVIQLQSPTTAATVYKIDFGRWVEFWGVINNNTGATQQVWLEFPENYGFHVYKLSAPGGGMIQQNTGGTIARFAVRTNSEFILRRPIICSYFNLFTINNTTLFRNVILVSELSMKDY